MSREGQGFFNRLGRGVEMKFRKKPVVIEAWEWDQAASTLELLFGLPGFRDAWSGHDTSPSGKVISHLRIKTLEGALNVSDGDWIIKGVKGEFYPCKPDIFELTYEPESTNKESAK